MKAARGIRGELIGRVLAGPGGWDLILFTAEKGREGRKKGERDLGKTG